MRIAIFTDTYLPIVNGKIVSILSIKEDLEKSGNEVYLIGPIKEKGNHILNLKFINSFKYPEYTIAIFPDLFKILKFIRKNKIELLHVHGIGFMSIKAALIKIKTGLPMITTYHMDIFYMLSYVAKNDMIYNFFEKLGRIILKRYFLRNDVVIAPSNITKSEIKNEFGIDAVTIPTGIDIEYFKHVNSKLKMKYSSNKIVLYIGRIEKEKNKLYK